jgi:hypothetical protein
MEPAQYYKDECFTVDKIPAMIRSEFYPYTKIVQKRIVKKDRKNRIILDLEDKFGNRKNLSLLLSVEYPPINQDGSLNRTTPPRFHINKKSFSNAVEALRNHQALEREMNKQFGSADATVEVVDDEILPGSY